MVACRNDGDRKRRPRVTLRFGHQDAPRGIQAAAGYATLLVAGLASYFFNIRIRRDTLCPIIPPSATANRNLRCLGVSSVSVRFRICGDLNVRDVHDSVWCSRPTASLYAGDHADVPRTKPTDGSRDADTSGELREAVLRGLILGPVPKQFDRSIRENRHHD